MGIEQTLRKYEPVSLHHETNVVWDTAMDSLVYDTDGKPYIDFTSGIFVANVGHNHPKVAEAIKRQAGKLIHSYAFYNEPRAKLVEKLCEMTGFEKVFLCSTGSEAIEAAIRVMGNRIRPAAVENSNHGRTQGARNFHPQITYAQHPPSWRGYGFSSLTFESYLGYNAQFHPKEWVQEWCVWAKENNKLVCFDEVQAGFGRTGKLFGYEHYDVKPDLVVVGKALGGGMPISGVLGSAELLDRATDLSSTHTGNPVCCAAALASLEVLEEEGLVERAREMGEWIEPYLKENFNHKIQGKGMVWALDIGDVDKANDIVDRCAKNGLLLVKTHRGTIKIGAPLVITKNLMMDGLGILKEVCDTLE